MNKAKSLGKSGEETVARYLSGFGFEILARNYVVKGGEIDIIASFEDIITFVEVKTRSEMSDSNGFDFIDKNKQNRIIKTAENYIYTNNITLQPRFDVAVVIYAEKTHINYIKNAFGVQEGQF
ncbi:MAG: YraN family protein [Oscillospiraceae bacterium]|jgi:putative endonuclease|nr:YraN family protein [Oscillospiraceae bacterium]